ncbi:MAG: nitrophenyl compound nitroreductase subunit ArsF family protein [Phocaeicola sp.]
MKRVLLIVCAVIGFMSCGKKQNNPADATTYTIERECVEVIYFHGKQRCITCNAIESLTEETIRESFSKEVEAGEILFKRVDISTQSGEKLADLYEVTWSSLYLNKWKDGEELRNNLTEFGFAHAKNSPEKFKEGVRKKLEELLKF